MYGCSKTKITHLDQKNMTKKTENGIDPVLDI